LEPGNIGCTQKNTFIPDNVIISASTQTYFYLVYIVKAGPKFDNTTKASEADIQYIVVTDASRMGLMVYARDPMTFYQVSGKK
jgi:hypothetical protein